MIKDNFGRIHDYLRISVIDKCNFSCVYCLPVKKHHFLPHQKLMKREEIFDIAKIFVELGVKKIRLTGGEPLLRADIKEIIEDLHTLNIELAITTNGYFLDNYLDTLIKNNVRSINVSLDTLNEQKFEAITGKNAFKKVYENILLLLKNNIHPKVNAVLINPINNSEIIKFIEWTKDLNIHLRFIEFMPFDSNNWDFNKIITLDDVLNILKSEGYSFTKLNDSKNSTSRAYKVNGYKGTFAIISTISNPFCSTCNRMRLTADGKLRNCLFAQSETDLLSAYRRGEDIRPMILENIKGKFFQRGGLPDFKDSSMLLSKLSSRKMIEIGG
ncbi:MAG TPA: GTP 3',8-cyclase MoaA [Bacteroidia bacterium]|nr:GTP 3',8-cyclase MoaA [Bacteroidia bacterium]